MKAIHIKQSVIFIIKKKNSRYYKRKEDYLFLQKLKCPKCNIILAGKTTTKKNQNS